MNLASAFGMEVIPEDATQVPQTPVTIKVKDWPVPAYSPYRKDQVLSATLLCLLRSVHATPKSPLKVLIDADNPEDAKNLKGFAGTYLTAEAEEQGGPTPVPGTRIATDERGVTYVVLAEAKPPPAEALKRPPPVMIPFRSDDETDSNYYEFLPVGAGDTAGLDRREMLGRPVTHFHDLFDRTQSTGPDINALTKLGILHRCQWTDADDETTLALALDGKAAREPAHLASTLAAVCYAAVLSSQPTENKPLTIKMTVPEDRIEESLAAFAKGEGWRVRPGEHEGRKTLSCRFIWDPNAGKLSAGSVPMGTLEQHRDRPWTMSFPPDNVAAELNP